MSNVRLHGSPVLHSDEIRLIRKVYTRIRMRGLLPLSPERRDDFAGYLLQMYLRGMVIEDGLFGLGVAAAKARFAEESPLAVSLSMTRVLVVEDDYYQASALQRAFEAAGASGLGPYGTEEEALSAIEDDVPDFAVIDLNLGRGQRFDVAEKLLQQEVPLCVVSGYIRNELPALPPGYERYCVVGKTRDAPTSDLCIGRHPAAVVPTGTYVTQMVHPYSDDSYQDHDSGVPKADGVEIARPPR